MNEIIITKRKGKFPIIKTNRLILRDIEVKDITPEYIKWLNDPKVNIYLDIGLVLQTEEMVREFIKEKLKNTKDTKHFGVYDNRGTRLVGTVTLPTIEWYHHCGEISFVIGHPDARRKGYATEALQGVINYLFTCCGLIKLWAGYKEGNIASAHVLEKNGFKEEGRLTKKYLNYKNERVDHVLVGLLADDYLRSSIHH
tara:strand:+ start:373 stop:966 length:594 start_codon:yes stop_codon:yes gene_type:complete